MTNEQTGILLENIYKRLNKAIHKVDEKIITEKYNYPLSELHSLIGEIGLQANLLKSQPNTIYPFGPFIP